MPERKLKPAVKSGSQQRSRKMRKTLSALQLSAGIATGLFIAGVIVPTVLGAGTANRDNCSAYSVHMFVLAGITFTYTLADLGFAVLGALFGAVVAWASQYPSVIVESRMVRFLLERSRLASAGDMQSAVLAAIRNWLRSAAQH